MNDSVAIRLLCAIVFGVLGIQGVVFNIHRDLASLALVISVAFLATAWAVWGRR